MGGTSQTEDAASLPARVADSPAIRNLSSRLEDGGVCSLTGICESAIPFLAAALSRALPERPLVLVADGLKAQESMLQDLQTWSTWSNRSSGPSPERPAVETASTPAARRGSAIPGGNPLFYPDWEVLPHEPRLPHVDVISDRIATLSDLDSVLTGRPGPVVVVASVVALLQRTFSRAELQRRLRTLRSGENWNPLDLIEWLEAQGYEPEAQVTQKGTLALRGGILDVWPPDAPWPARLEFFGDTLESMRCFDPVTQLSREGIGELRVGPAGELGILKRLVQESADAGAFGTLLDHLPPRAILLLGDPGPLQERVRDYEARVPSGDPFLMPWARFLESARARGDTIVQLLPGLERGPVGTRDGEESASELRLESLEVFRPLGVHLPDPAVAEAQRRSFFQQLHRWLRGGLEVHVVCNNAGERQRFAEIWAEYGFDEATAGLAVPGAATAPGAEEPRVAGVEPPGGWTDPGAGRLVLHLGALARGFLCPSGGFVVVTDAEIFGRYRVLRPRRLRSPQARTSRSLLDIDFTEFEDGDYVVHVEHGIGRFLGLQKAPETPGHRGARGEPGQECLVIEYAAARPEDPPPRLFVPVSEAHLVSKYVGAGKARPPLNVLGGTRWTKAKKDAERAVADLASDLLAIQAARETQEGHAFPADSPWQREFEAAFLYEETDDQERAIEATKRDMERARPMDRLVCGDVGFGKTEVAIRAAFKAVMGGKQVAVLVPTTVLAQQHFNTFRERMSDYPVRVELLSRFRSRREQQRVITELEAGAIDIVIGTHRLVQRDVGFKDLGLVVIDEEQRFGVLHKERFKMLRRTIDVLTLSATPIPRTLYLALSGARDMSTIETPPQDRLPVETQVAAYDERLIRDAIQRELDRQGQVFFLHNRVTTIDTVAAKLRALVPKARLVVGHGQMDPDDLEEVMTRFVNGEADVLLSTTIIESGLDIPNANTIIIDRADRFGLSELYQLRGRVGRYKHQAYAYLLIPRHAQLLSEARKRIAAIRQYSSLGSGFKIAMRDLEIRGAGNLLGPQQSGHITAVGFDLYCQLLKQSISALKGEKVQPRVEVQVRLDFLLLNPAEEGVAGSESGRPVAMVPPSYVPEGPQRLEIHRRLAQVTAPADLRRIKADLRDRFGPLPPPMELLLAVAELRLIAAAADVTSIETRGDKLILQRHGDYVQVGGRFPRLTRREARARMQEVRRFLGALTPRLAAPAAAAAGRG